MPERDDLLGIKKEIEKVTQEVLRRCPRPTQLKDRDSEIFAMAVKVMVTEILQVPFESRKEVTLQAIDVFKRSLQDAGMELGLAQTTLADQIAASINSPYKRR